MPLLPHTFTLGTKIPDLNYGSVTTISSYEAEIQPENWWNHVTNWHLETTYYVSKYYIDLALTVSNYNLSW
jgi:hypothetical protein